MSNQGEVSVSLRLLLTELQKDIKKASDMMKAGLAFSVKGTAKDVDKSSEAMDKFTAKTRRATDALKEQKKAAMDAWRASLPAPVVRMEGERPAGYTPQTGNQPWQVPGSGGGGLATPPPTGTSGTGGGGGGGSSWLRSLVGFGAVLAAVRVMFGYLKFAINAVLGPLRELQRAAKEAARNVIGGLQSGRPLGLQVQSSMMGKVLGVSADEAMYFGIAIQGVAERLKASSTTMEEMTPNLFSLHVALSSAWQSFKAFTAVLLNASGSIIFDIAEELRSLFDVLQNSYITDALGLIIAAFVELAKVAVKVVSLIVKAIAALVNVVGDLAGWLIAKNWNIDMKPLSDRTDRLLEAGWNKGEISAAEAPAAKRMQSSPWERMGLIIGPGKGIDYTKATAENTKTMVGLLQMIAGGGVARTGQMSFTQSP